MIDYKSEFMEVIFHEENSVIEFIWSDATLELTDELFRKELQQQAKSVDYFKPVNVLANTTKFIFPIAPDTQDWIDATIFPAWAQAGVKKMGLIVSPEMISQLSMKQTIGENSQDAFVCQFFEDKNKALAWFNQE